MVESEISFFFYFCTEIKTKRGKDRWRENGDRTKRGQRKSKKKKKKTKEMWKKKTTGKRR